MMKTNVTTHIFARAAKANLAGEFPIYIRITIDGKRSEFSTRKFIHPKKWDQRTMRVKGSTEEARTLNSYLDAMQNKITQTQVHFQYLDSPVTVDHFVATLLGRKTERERTIMPIFQDHNQRMHALLHIEYAPGTYERYQTSLKHTQDLIRYQYKLDDIPLSRINHSFIADYDFYLRTVRSCGNKQRTNGP